MQFKSSRGEMKKRRRKNEYKEKRKKYICIRNEKNMSMCKNKIK
jgi:hypothetical protein